MWREIPTYRHQRISLLWWAGLTRFAKNFFMAYTEEAQQFGEITEISAVAGLLVDCFLTYGGDRKQTPGWVREGEEARKLRRLLLNRCHGLRCNTTYFQGGSEAAWG